LEPILTTLLSNHLSDVILWIEDTLKLVPQPILASSLSLGNGGLQNRLHRIVPIANILYFKRQLKRLYDEKKLSKNKL
jgi:hypothetical protein